MTPNRQPTTPLGGMRLAVVAECPGIEEEHFVRCPRGHAYASKQWIEGRLHEVGYCSLCGSSEQCPDPTPLVGPSGRLLNWLLAQAGIRRESVFVGNCCQVPAKGDLLDDPTFPGLVSGLAALQADLASFRPNAVLCLGNVALRAFHPHGWERNAKGELTTRVTDWRGSIFSGTWGYKCVAAYHPAACLRMPEWTPMLRLDVVRAVAEAATPDLNLPRRAVERWLDARQIVERLAAIRREKKRVGFDIEGYPQSGVTDSSFATRPDYAIWIPFRRCDGTPWWAPADEQQIMAAWRAVLEDPNVPKVMHNALYEMFVLKWAHGVTLRGVGGDTMLLWHEIYAELDKALDVAASVATRQPYWKYGRDATSDEERATYNCIDSMVTLELEENLLAAGELTPKMRAHYEHRLSLLEPTIFQMTTGFNFDAEARQAIVAGLRQDIAERQGELDELAGIDAPSLREVVETVCNKRLWDKCVDWADVPLHANKRWLEELENV